MAWGEKNTYMRLPVIFSFFEVEPNKVKGYVNELRESVVSDVTDIVGEKLLAGLVEGITGKKSNVADNWKMQDIAKQLK